jgi:peptidoglycan hydrolase-like protein with peptidoglycan-binding domain
MGAIRNTWSKPAKPDRGRAKAQESGGHPGVTSLQKWLAQNGKLDPQAVTGVYDELTHDAVDKMQNDLVGKNDPASKNAIKVMDYLLAHKVSWLKANPDLVSQALVALQQAQPAAQPQQRSLKDTPYYEIMYDGKKLMLPLALVYNRGYAMYRVILEQNGLLNMSDSFENRIAQLNKAIQAIQASLPASNPDNTNILYIVTEADKDLRESWSGGNTSANMGAESISKALERLVPEFAKASDSEKEQIVGMIYYRFPQAEKFMEAPPNINSRIKDLAEFRRNQHSLTGAVIDRLRRLQVMK